MSSVRLVVPRYISPWVRPPKSDSLDSVQGSGRRQYSSMDKGIEPDANSRCFDISVDELSDGW